MSSENRGLKLLRVGKRLINPRTVSRIVLFEDEGGCCKAIKVWAKSIGILELEENELTVNLINEMQRGYEWEEGFSEIRTEPISRKDEISGWGENS